MLPERSPGTFVGIGVLSPDGVPIFTSQSEDAGIACPAGPGEFEACVTVPPDTFLAGDFHLALCLWNGGGILDLQEPALSFSVETGSSPLYRGSPSRKGFVHVDCTWSVTRSAVVSAVAAR